MILEKINVYQFFYTAIFCLILLCQTSCRTNALQKTRVPVIDTKVDFIDTVNYISDGSIYHSNYQLSLYDNKNKSYQPGDIIQVNLVEDIQTTESESSSSSKDNAINDVMSKLFGAIPTLAGTTPLTLDQLFSTSNSSSGSFVGNTGNKIQGSIGVVVKEVLPNGNLLIVGERVLNLQHGQETVRLQGFVRPNDIESNIIKSNKIADAKIIYLSDGLGAECNEPGLIWRLFNAYWPF